MIVGNKDYGIVNYNIKDSVGQFTYKVKLSDHIDYDKSTGYLYCIDAIVGNVGIQIYRGSELGFADGNRIVKVHRKEEYIFAEDSLESLKGKPITLEHPQEMVTSENIREYGMGTILDVGRREGDNILCNLVIHDKNLIDRIAPEDEDGNRAISDEFRDLSLGYNAKLLPYEDTDEYVQTDIEYNHLAVVKTGRAANAIIRDSAEEKKEKKPMKFFDWLLGKKIKDNEDGTITVLDDDNPERVVAKRETITKEEYVDPYEHDKVIKTETTIKTVTKEDDGPDAEIEDENENEKGETIMKDKAYFAQAFKDAQALPEGPFRDDTIKALNDEYLELFPREIKDEEPKVSVTDSLKVTKTEDNVIIKDEKKDRIDFDALEKESMEYYDKLTNPESRFHMDHAAWEKFFKSEQRSGKSSLNL
jgi:hypothetical protein